MRGLNRTLIFMLALISGCQTIRKHPDAPMVLMRPVRAKVMVYDGESLVPYGWVIIPEGWTATPYDWSRQ